MEFDYAIVGGGSAGCVLAHRLSAHSANRVLLIEAGRDLVEGDIPADIRDSYPGTAYINSKYLWSGLTVRSAAVGGNRGPEEGARRGYSQGRILGGGSSINGQMANWGVPSDYDGWEELGARGWNWDAVRPFFRKVERDLDFPGPEHGHDGKIAVRRIFPEQWSGHSRAIGQALEQRGFRYIADQNGDFGDGYFPIVHANVGEERVTAATTYLDAATRRRPNLMILTETQVTGLVFEGSRCVGVRVEAHGKAREFRAGETILSAGAIHSPAILMRAGIGPGAHLMELGIPVLHHLAGVGQNLMDHPQVAIGSYLKRRARGGRHTRRHVLVGLRYSSGLEGAPSGDMFALALDRTAWHAVGEQLGGIGLWVNKTYSRDGEVRLASADWRAEPRVDFNLLSDRRDLVRLMDGFRMFGAMEMSQAMRAVAEMPFPACYTDRARQVGVVNRKNRFLTGLMARLLDGPAPLRRALLRRFVIAHHDFEEVMRDDSALEAFIFETVTGIFHASCTCRMGDAGNPLAVTDADGLVHGVEGLRVADASVFPAVPSANTNFPTYMVAEKIADAILSRTTAGASAAA